MSKRNRQQRAAKRAQAQKLVRQPPIVPLPRVFPTVREPFYLPELLGMTPKCWQGDCPENRGGPVISHPSQIRRSP